MKTLQPIDRTKYEGHTAAPWYVGMRPGPMIYGGKGAQVADCRADLVPGDEGRANHNLIIDAPALLARNIEADAVIAEQAARIAELEDKLQGQNYCHRCEMPTGE